MKKLIFISVVFLISITAKAQYEEHGISFGPAVGFNSYTLSTDYHDYNTTTINSWKIGMYFRLRNKKFFYIQPEALFNTKGGKLDFDLSNVNLYNLNFDSTLQNAQLDVSLQTLDVPILIGMHLIRLGKFNIRAVGGPVVTYIINEDVSLTVDGLNKTGLLPNNLYKDASFGVQYGGGMDIGRFTFDFRYDYGLTNFSSITSIQKKSNGYSFSLGLKLY